MKYTRKAGLTIEAVQWTGNNLRQLQDFMAPGSPMVDLVENKERTIMVMAYSIKQTYTDREFATVKPGSFIVKDPSHPHFDIYTAEVFDKLFELATPLETVEPEGLVTHAEPGLASHMDLSDR